MGTVKRKFTEAVGQPLSNIAREEVETLPGQRFYVAGDPNSKPAGKGEKVMASVNLDDGGGYQVIQGAPPEKKKVSYNTSTPAGNSTKNVKYKYKSKTDVQSGMKNGKVVKSTSGIRKSRVKYN